MENNTAIALIKAATDNLPSDPADASVVAGLIATLQAFVDTEVAAILAAVDTEVAAIKAKTDSLTFTTANIVDANPERINNVAITGDGSGTSSLTSTNVRRAHRRSAQEKQLTRTTSTGPATGTSANRCRRRWCTRLASTPHYGHGASVAIAEMMTWRR